MRRHHYGSEVQIGVSGSWLSGGRYVARSTAYAVELHDLTVLLVHGFNVSPWNANDAYDTFRINLFDSGAPEELHVVSVGWPGDVAYPSAPTIATDAACALADYIEQLNSPGFERALYIVCHSLGCRYVLEALRLLQNKPNARLPRQVTLFLLAAAVPVEFADINGRLSGLLPARLHTTVFFSESDWVLRWLFPLGQKASADRHTVAIEAVGLRGNPKGVWTGGAMRMARYGHSDYWRSWEIAKQLGEALRNETRARPLSIPERQIKRRLVGR